MAVTTHKRRLGTIAHCHCCNAPIPPTEECVIRDISWEVAVAEQPVPNRFDPNAPPPGVDTATYRREQRRATIHYSRTCWSKLHDGIVAYATHRGLSDSPIAHRRRAQHKTFEEAHTALKNIPAVLNSQWNYKDNTYHVTTRIRSGYTVPAEDIVSQLHRHVQSSTVDVAVEHEKKETIKGVPDREQTVLSYSAARLSPTDCLPDHTESESASIGDPPHPAAVPDTSILVDARADTVLAALQRVAPWLRRIDMVINLGDNKPHLTAVVDGDTSPGIHEATVTLRAAGRELEGWDEETVIGITEETIPEMGFDSPWETMDAEEGEVNMLDLPPARRTGGVTNGQRVVVRRAIWDALMGRSVQGDNRTKSIVSQSGATVARLGFQLREVMDEPRVNPRCRYGRIIAYEPVTDHAIVQHDDGTMGHWSTGWLMAWNKPPPKALSPKAAEDAVFESNRDTLAERLRQRKRRTAKRASDLNVDIRITTDS